MYSTADHRQKRQSKHNPQQAAQNQPTEGIKTHQLLNYQTWDFSLKK
jgi:hypothetical protein